MYYNYFKIIKYVSFELIHLVIIFDVVSCFEIFDEFDYVFLSNILLV